MFAHAGWFIPRDGHPKSKPKLMTTLTQCPAVTSLNQEMQQCINIQKEEDLAPLTKPSRPGIKTVR
jgi:hypothetical protein